MIETMTHGRGCGRPSLEKILRNSLFLLQETSEKALDDLGVEEQKPHRTALEKLRHETAALKAEWAIRNQEQQSNGICCLLVKCGGLRTVPDWLWEEARKRPKLRKQLAAAVEFRLAHPLA